MKNSLKPKADTIILAEKLIFAAFNILHEAKGELPGKEVIERIRKRVQLSDWAKEVYEKTGYTRWISILHFYTIDCIKAAFLRKDKGVWYLTDEGEKAIKLGPEKLLETVIISYKNWKKNQETTDINEPSLSGQENIDSSKLQQANIDMLEEQAVSGLIEHVFSKNPYEFQDMVAALLRAMDYYTPFISSRGADGGIDIIAYKDPLGASEPRIKVQVKHKPTSSIPVSEIVQLLGTLSASGDIGLFVTSGKFSSSAEKRARNSQIHIKLIDIETFISLWIEFYPKMNDEMKNMLPLHPIYFLGSNE